MFISAGRGAANLYRLDPDRHQRRLASSTQTSARASHGRQRRDRAEDGVDGEAGHIEARRRICGTDSVRNVSEKTMLAARSAFRGA